MNLASLRAALDRAGVPEADYVVNARPGRPARRAGDHLYLDSLGEAGWAVGQHERGQDTRLRVFADEDAACRFLYARLTEQGPPPGPGASERLAAISEDAAEIERLAWERFRAAGEPGGADF